VATHWEKKIYFESQYLVSAEENNKLKVDIFIFYFFFGKKTTKNASLATTVLVKLLYAGLQTKTDFLQLTLSY